MRTLGVLDYSLPSITKNRNQYTVLAEKIDSACGFIASRPQNCGETYSTLVEVPPRLCTESVYLPQKDCTFLLVFIPSPVTAHTSWISCEHLE
ncbi:hypothetical protein Y032_0202g1776 [Ancylostoma ceylanicum]|uniref:Uncharacterized protein n=1 Tax=Ancylostoma ceylanicum TaxID=53326 RepID=A0A016SN26_9BILA|nr:hypothetical protein Y032_0202g1776 [Ancylostoma ceylanicum]